MRELGFIHRFVPGEQKDLTLLLLHGTGGSESDLIPLGQALMPGASLLSPRGRVMENGMPRFFRRFAEGVFDEEDIRRRAGELSEFVQMASTGYGFDPERVVAVGYSNGANIAAALLLLHPGTLAGAVLLRAMVPLEPDETPDLRAKPVLLAAGQRDPIVPAANVERLAQLLRSGGALVTLNVYPRGHELGNDEVEAARNWLASFRMTPPRPSDDGA